MLYIDDSLPHIQLAKNNHIKQVSCYITKKLYGNDKAKRCKDLTCNICARDIRKVKNLTQPWQAAFEHIGIENLVKGTPDALIKLNKKFWTRLGIKFNQLSEDQKEMMGKIINYDEWSSKRKGDDFYNAYDLCNSLKIETCVYCNRLYTSTIINEKKERIIRPTLDHWFPQTDYPLLALSFYNLIPSCSPCNSSVKHTASFKLSKNIHPYVDQKITDQYRLVSTYDKTLNTFKISLDTQNAKIKSTLDLMKIGEIYQHHQSELADLDFLKRKYNPQYLKNLRTLLNVSLTEKELYRVMFGVEYDQSNFSNRPLSKLKKDILDFKLK